MKGKKIISLLLSTVLFVTAFFSPAAAGAAPVKLDYVALGDSLAAGQDPYGNKTSAGYADFIAAKWKQEGKLGSYTKEYAKSGATTADVLAGLQLPDVQQAVKQAEVITLSAGANDLFKVVKVNPSTGKIEVNQEEALRAWAALQENLIKINKQLKQLNPQAKVYIMGYFFAFPHFAEGTEKEQAKTLTLFLNQKIEQAAKQNGNLFVSVQEFDKNGASYLPNPADVHPNEAGYQVMADAFFKVYKPGVYFSDLPASPQAQQAILVLAEAGILNGKPNGTFEPGRNITRAEAAIIFANLLPWLPESPKKPVFKDISPSMKSYKAIAQLTEAGIFSKAPRFNPNQPLTRAQMARLLTVIYKLEAQGSVNFKDVPANFWAKEEISAVTSNSLMIGFQNNTFQPNKPITRAEFAITIYRVKEAARFTS
ncbi:S-layer homology domain-containing protein [Pseudobacillus wudalianchiensis]|uniref:SLH domain-containing protein n=1 Tax=Pseudobacillus wudalianchiensis TaxID=1743143 RepID=A0A1B9AYU4_9BACI|nr:S-layer homology domain-containing protein [Bacillus wudalianchiensis]OCA88908.1 hypothetical protein A8F95_05650 [Bacillus wudalianchiensis]